MQQNKGGPVPQTSVIERAISILANTMRIYVESQVRFGALFDIDREEAINNVDRAFEAKLEAFHALYDVSKHLFPYFDHGDTALIVAVRNAIHHRDHPLFHSLISRLYLEGELSHWVGASFLLTSYPTLHDATFLMSHYFRLDDICARLDPKLSSPHLDVMLKLNKAELRFMLIERQLGFLTIHRKATSEHYPQDQIYLDLIPVFTSAVCRVFKAMKGDGIAFRGFDAEVYMRPFTSEIEIDLCSPTFRPLLIGG